MACNPLWVLCVTAPKFCSSEHLHTHLTLNCSVTFLCVSLHTVRAVVWGQNMQWAIFTGQLSAAVLEEEGESPRVCTWHVCNTPWALDTESAQSGPRLFSWGEHAEWTHSSSQGPSICLFNEWQKVRTANFWNGGWHTSYYESRCAWARNHLLASEVPGLPGGNRGELRYFIWVSQEKKAADESP